MRSAAALSLALALSGCGSSEPGPMPCRVWGHSKETSADEAWFHATEAQSVTPCYAGTYPRVEGKTRFRAPFGQARRTLLYSATGEEKTVMRLEILIAARPGSGPRSDVPTTVTFKAFEYDGWTAECTSTISLLESVDADVNVRGDVTCLAPLQTLTTKQVPPITFDGPLHFEGRAD